MVVLCGGYEVLTGVDFFTISNSKMEKSKNKLVVFSAIFIVFLLFSINSFSRTISLPLFPTEEGNLAAFVIDNEMSEFLCFGSSPFKIIDIFFKSQKGYKIWVSVYRSVIYGTVISFYARFDCEVSVV